uniref:Formate dehydrogenase subunit gamma n=1 Tax=Acidicaldus sp. TaxID=1872105 RepID=A0A8J4M571_9PROT
MHEYSAWDDERASEIITPWCTVEGGMLPALHALMAEFGAVPDAAVPLLAQQFNLSCAEIRGIISFYHDFRSTPPGRHVLKLCRAEACQSMHGATLAENLLARLGLTWGATTTDGALTIEPVYCLGLCAVAPAALFDEVPQGRLDVARLDRLVTAAR